MGALGQLMLVLFTGLADFFVKFFSQQVALRLAFAALMVAAFATLWAAMQGLLTAITVTAPDVVVAGLSMVLPSNVAGCVSAMLSADAAVAGYRLYCLGIGRGV